MVPSTTNPSILYKVLRDGVSCHGGSLRWSLPTRNQDGTWTPGDWHEVAGALVLCQNGLHLTTQPAAWYLDGATLYRAEYDGELAGDLSSDKVAVRRARLTAEVDWSEGQVYRAGTHVVRSGLARASGSATVTAYGSATVRAYGSATVTAYGSATVAASGSATVTAYGSATVTAYGSATVTAYDSATVISAPWHSTSAQVALANRAAHVDRRGNTVICRVAGEGA